MRVGVIGLGRIGARHAATLLDLPGVDSVVVTDAVPATIERVSADLDVETAATPSALLGANVDGVVIAAATGAHAELIGAAVQAGVPVFCEKPVAGTVEEAVAVQQRVRGRGVPVQIGFNRRFDPGVVAARRAVLSGVLGRLHTVRSTTMDPAPPPATYLAASGGIFRDCAVHDFDVIRYVTGREVTEVYAAGDADTVSTLLTLDDGAVAVVSNTRYNGAGYDVRLELHGSRASVAAGWDDRMPMRSTEPGARIPAAEPYRFFLDRFAAAYRAELAAFLEVIAGARRSPCTITDGVEAARIAEACDRSLDEHRPVALDEISPGRGGPVGRCAG
ncbi:Gfo/Idh/MocA family oxidoreductase [Actinoplanes aureus]|uniref:Gfo/Idh/MocA family oxidoreductase n=1 Tax=Actinoplanes aureus TaxID=2792083 RepID=A0A931CAY4_9ACTN|nr:Gfo/Idh/MocA family oxidoreductase [Actinoplanes aureus]MBG0564617.1 Gfo/Idh/MocA family oxidoreductase [Actinoplanes aureus]